MHAMREGSIEPKAGDIELSRAVPADPAVRRC
jgi:hypothetical protein